MKIFDITNTIPQTKYSLSRQYSQEGICYHITGDSEREQAVSWFRNPTSQVSAHYIIEKNGDTFLCVHPDHKAYHCGKVNKATAQIYFDKGQRNPNNYLIGIECVSSGEDLTTQQWESLINLTLDLCNTYNIKVDRYHLIGHNELDSIGRALDPISSYKVENVINAVEFIKMQGGVKKMDWKEILKQKTDSPDRWVTGIETAVNVAKSGNLGDLKILEFLPQLIEKINK